MRSITEQSRIIMNDRRNFVNYADVTLSDGTVLNLKPSDFRLSGNSFTDDWSEGNAFQIGSAIGKTATITIDNTDNREEVISGQTVKYPHGKFSEYDFYMSYFVLYVALPDTDVKLRIGTFTVTEPVASGSIIEITGIDNMYLFDRSFDDCTLDFSSGVTLETVLNRCCSDCDIVTAYTTFTNSNLVVKEKPTGVTYRQVVSYIATIACSVARISPTGALRLDWYDMSVFKNNWLDGGTFSTSTTPYSDGDSADGGSFNPWNTGDTYDGGDFATPSKYHNLYGVTNVSVSTDDIVITGVKVTNNNITQHYPTTTGWDNYIVSIENNPFVAGNELTIATSVYNKLANLKFRTFSCSSIQDPSIEAGDCAIVYDVKGNAYYTIITNVTYTTGGYTEIKCSADSPISQNSRYTTPASAVAKQAVNTYSSQVAYFNELASKSLGYYQTQVTDSAGATITYVHDAKTLASSKTVWKITVDGYFVTEDYKGTDAATSWNTGYDASTGSMLLNTLYAHGLNADWINTGTITIGGTTGNINGSIVIKNASGTQIGKWDKDGISASSGTFSGTLSGATGTITDATGTLSLSGGNLNMRNNKEDGPGLFAYGKDNIYSCWGAKNSAAHNGSAYLETPTYEIIATVDKLYPVKQTLRNMADGSDKRLKKDIKDLDADLAYNLIMSVKPKEYKFKDRPNELNFGVIAQDIRTIEDNIGIDKENTRICYTREYDNMYGVQYDQFIAPMIKVIQKQQEEIDLLKADIMELKNIVKNTN